MEMHLFIILTIHTGGIVMKNLTQPMGLNQLYRYIVNACPAMDVGDIRPYKTLMRYIQNRGYVVFAGGPGAVLLEKKHQLNSGGPERPLRIDELCKTAGRWARAAERAAPPTSGSAQRRTRRKLRSCLSSVISPLSAARCPYMQLKLLIPGGASRETAGGTECRQTTPDTPCSLKWQTLWER